MHARKLCLHLAAEPVFFFHFRQVCLKLLACGIGLWKLLHWIGLVVLFLGIGHSRLSHEEVSFDLLQLNVQGAGKVFLVRKCGQAQLLLLASP